MNQDLKDYLRAKLDRAEMWNRCCSEEDKKFYQGQIVAYRNVYKQLESEQCNIPDVGNSLCNHVFQQKDTVWMACVHCGKLKPLRTL